MKIGRALAILMLLAALTPFSYSQDIDKLKIKGGFRNCDIYEYRYTDGVLDSNSKFKSIAAIYNENGKVKEYSKFYSDSITYKTFFEYNSFGKRTKKLVFNEKGLITLMDSVIYDNNGLVIETGEYYGDGSPMTYKFSFKYDSLGNRTEQVEYKKDGSFDSKIKYSYNDSGKIIKSCRLDIHNLPRWTSYYTYGNDGNLLEKVEYNAEGMREQITLYTNDSVGNLIKKNFLNGDSTLISLNTYKYDKNRNQIENILYNSKAETEIKYINQYDDDGNLLENVTYTEYRKNGSVSDKNINKYDAIGNIIEKVHFAEIDKPEKKYEYVYY